MSKKPYTQKDTELMLKEYTTAPLRETVNELSKKLGRSEKSIIGKLAREGVYQKQVYKSKTGENPITKVQIVEKIAEKVEIQPQRLEGLEKSPKGVLKILCEHIG